MGLRSLVLGYWPDDGQSDQAGQRRTLGLALERRASRRLYGAGRRSFISQSHEANLARFAL